MNHLQDLQYAGKVIRSFLSGYEGLAEKIYECEGESEWGLLVEGDSPNPYYVCLQFHNGRHLPLPIFDECDTGDDVGIFQKLAVKACRYLCGSDYNKAAEQAESLLKNDGEYDPRDGKWPDFTFGEISLRWEEYHKFFHIYLGVEIFFYFSPKEWYWPRFQNHWHEGHWYGWSALCGPINILW